MTRLSFLLPAIRCPQCRLGELAVEDHASEWVCRTCGERYPIVHGCPVLLRSDNPLFRSGEYRKSADPVSGERSQGLRRLVPDPSINLARKGTIRKLRSMLLDREKATVLVVGGGSQRSRLDEQLAADGSIRIVYSDVDPLADVDLYCDGHDLPFADGAFDAVVTTAVLEHVLSPERVVAELHRVLKTGGTIYSELPFMQQVHEGAYDFTRYTHSGHRRLMNGFSEIESGMVAGPATALVWALENFAIAFVERSLLRSAVKAMVRCAFSWLKHFDRLLAGRPAAMDAASCTYFLGAKIEGRIADAEIVARYAGAKHRRPA